jgi:SAM-dependent methyltransferase
MVLMTKSAEKIDAKKLYSSLRTYGPTAKGLLTPDEAVLRQRLDAAALLARYCASSWNGGNVLDIGCGYGSMIPLLQKITTNHRYTGVDMTDWILEVARDRYGAQSKLQLLNKSMDQLDVGDEADLVLMLGILATTNDDELEPILGLASSLSRKALILSWTEKNQQYSGKLKAHRIEQLNKFLGPHSLVIGFGPDEPHRIALWIRQ